VGKASVAALLYLKIFAKNHYQRRLTLHYSDIFQGKDFNHFTTIKRNRKNEFSVDV